MSSFRIAESPSVVAKIWVSVLFLAIAFGVYGSSLRNDFVRWDDGLLIYENPIVREQSLQSIGKAFTSYDPELYIPLTFLSYKVDYAIGGIDPTSYRVQNLLWHTGAALLVTWIAWLLLGSPWALVAGLLFLLHPLHTEAVAWASARKDVLSAFWALACMVAYLSFRREADDDAPHARRWLWWSVGFFLLALLSKVVVVLLPLVLLLVDWLTGRRIDRRSVGEKWPFLLLSILFGVVALLGKSQMIQGLAPGQTSLVALRSTSFFLQKLLWPTGLSVLYPYGGPITLAQPAFAVSLLIVLALLTVAYVMRRRVPLITFAVLWMLILLLPTFTNFYKGGVVYLFSDRYGYLPSVGLFVLLSWGVHRVIQAAATVRVERLQSRVMAGLFCLLLLLLAQRSYAQAAVWRNSETLFAHVLRFYPDSWVARNNLANAYRRRGELVQARDELEAALRGEPASPTASENTAYAKIRMNLGEVARLQGQTAEADSLYQAALKQDPHNANAHIGMGLLDAAAGNSQGALQHYAQALDLSPDSVQAFVNRGVLKLNTQDLDGAIADFRAAIAIQPDLADAQYNLALALEAKGDTAGAAQAYRAAIDASPRAIAPRINLGLLLFNAGDRAGSKSVFQQILTIDPTNRAARQALEQLR